MQKIEKSGCYLVTGGASGLGAETVRLLLTRGANVMVLDIKSDEKLMKDCGSKVGFAQTDVTSEESVKKAIEKAKSQFGRINGVVNCAGISFPSRTATTRGPHDLELFKRVIDVNLNGTFNISRLAAFEMIKQPLLEGQTERGAIINVASVAYSEGQIGQVSYSASKGAVVSMTLVMARDLAPYKIRVNTIAPGIFETPMMLMMPEEGRNKLTSQAAFPQRMGKPQEFAHLVVALIENQMMNGATIRLDGGIRMAAL
jgi:3-hydroxyacyl-CoA dehydrogenase/3-hydroxy-2-methylbutyryl-CoA dehydrogenase